MNDLVYCIQQGQQSMYVCIAALLYVFLHYNQANFYAQVENAATGGCATIHCVM